jgi:hypothetical protein
MIDMVLFFKNLDSLVDRWLSFKMKSAVDEQYFVEKHIDFSTLVASEQCWILAYFQKTNISLLQVGGF